MHRRVSLGAIATLALAGCGFRLRHSAGLPFETLFTGFAPNSAVGAEFRRVVRSSSGTRIVDDRSQADAILVVLAEQREKEVIGFSTTGRPREYELRLRLIFRLDDPRGRSLLPTTSLVVRREISTGDIQLLSKQIEEEQIYREMRSDLVQQMVRRLSTIRRDGR